MLRAGPLSSPQILERLERDFVNTWILRKDLEALTASADPALAAIARRVADAYLDPVDSLVLSDTGELLDHACANDMEDDSRYVRLLDAARR